MLNDEITLHLTCFVGVSISQTHIFWLNMYLKGLLGTVDALISDMQLMITEMSFILMLILILAMHTADIVGHSLCKCVMLSFLFHPMQSQQCAVTVTARLYAPFRRMHNPIIWGDHVVFIRIPIMHE